MPLGPEQLPAADPAFYERARAAAGRCGVTRLADITGLDRLGLPVWQAVRPAGKALSVHQGKAATPLAAKLGALCEAIECHSAENAVADGPVCAFEALPRSRRAPQISDYARRREKPPAIDAPIAWCTATDLASGAEQYIPHPLVSLDFTQGLPSRFERISSGLGAGPDERHALQNALLELVERDACGDWERQDWEVRQRTRIDNATIHAPWFRGWLERFRRLAVQIDLFHAPSILGVPVLICFVEGEEEFGSAWRIFSGAAAHPDPEIALFKALAEAIQSRLTWIAGVRDDFLPSEYSFGTASGPLPAGCWPWPLIVPSDGGFDAIVERLAARGYDRVLVKRIDQGLDGVAVTRVFVPGLGSLTRTRR